MMLRVSYLVGSSVWLRSLNCVQLPGVVGQGTLSFSWSQLRLTVFFYGFFFFSSRRRHTRSDRDWSSDVCSSDLICSIVTLPLARGLNVLTGETGAGKSMLVDALALLLGERASADVVRPGAEREIGRASCRERV